MKNYDYMKFYDFRNLISIHDKSINYVLEIDDITSVPVILRN